MSETTATYVNGQATSSNGKSISIPEQWRALAPILAKWAYDSLTNQPDAHGHYLPLNKREKNSAYAAKSGFHWSKLKLHFEGQNHGNLGGMYTTSKANTSRWAAIDIDRHCDESDAEANETFVLDIAKRASELGFEAIVEDSNGSGGFHIWILFAEPRPTVEVFAFAKWLIRDWKEHRISGKPETFPKQAVTTAKQPYGNWLRVPGRHHTRDHWSRIYDITSERWLEGTEAIQAILKQKGSETPFPSCTLVNSETNKATAEPTSGNSSWVMTATSAGRDAVGDLQNARDALSYYRNNDLHYDDWLKVAMSLRGLESSGLSLWREWSETSSKYVSGSCEAKWPRITPNGGRGLGSLFYEAKQAGWPGPSKKAAKRSAKGLAAANQQETSEECADPSPLDIPAIRAKVEATMTEDGKRPFEILLQDREFLTELARLQLRDEIEFESLKAILLKATPGFKARPFNRVIKAIHEKEAFHFKQTGDLPVGDSSKEYLVQNGCIGIKKLIQMGERYMYQFLPVTNFNAKITAEIERHESGDIQRFLRIEATDEHGLLTRQCDVSVKEYDKMEWVTSHLPVDFTIEAGAGKRDHARAAIRTLSLAEDIPTLTVYTSTGWVEYKEKDFYVHAGGTIGGGDQGPTIQVDVCRDLVAYELPIPSNDITTIQAAIRESLTCLDIGKHSTENGAIASALLGLVYRSVIEECSFTVALTGTTAAGKTTATECFMRHFGPGVSRKQFGSWDATINGIEALQHNFKDTVLYGPRKISARSSADSLDEAR